MKAFSGFFICYLHGSGELLCGKDEENGSSGQNSGTDITGHIRTGAVVEAGTDLGAYKGTDAVADKDKAVVPVVEHGILGADMKVSLENDGPFTVIFDESLRG